MTRDTCLLLVAIISVASVERWQSATYLPMFALGVLLAVERQRVLAFFEQAPRLSGFIIAVAGVALVTASWSITAILGVNRLHLVGLEVVGSTMIVALFLAWPPAQSLGTTSPLRWLGVRSFSLYLIHEPIVVSVALLLGRRQPAFLLAVVLPVALLLADLFYRFAEGPSHRFAQRVGGRRPPWRTSRPREE